MERVTLLGLSERRHKLGWIVVFSVSLVVLAFAGSPKSISAPHYLSPGLSDKPGSIIMPRIFLPFIVRQESSQLPLYRLTVDPADLDWLYDVDNRWTYETVPAVFTYDGTNHDVRVRFRGGTTRYLSKKSWKVDFPAAVPFQGQRELNLNAEYPDKSLLREALAYDLFDRAGLTVPRTQYVRLEVNGEYIGLFLQVEQVDQRFLDRVGWDPNGNLYKGDYGGNFDWGVDYVESYVKKTNREDSHDDIIDFLRVINLTPEDELPEALTDKLDVGRYLDWFAVQIVLGSYEWLEKNYYVYRPLNEDRWSFIPWDLDLTLGHNWGANGILDRDISWDNPIDSGTRDSPKADEVWNQLITKVLSIEEFKFAYCRRLWELMNDEFAETVMHQRIDAFYEPIISAAEADSHKWGSNEEFHDGPAELKTYVTNRLAWLTEQIPGYCPDSGPMPLINELMSDNRTTITDENDEHEPWIELYNPGLVSFDVGGMILQTIPTGTLALQWAVPSGTVIPPDGFLLIWADGEPEEGPLHASFRLDIDGGLVTLLDKAIHGDQVVDQQAYGPLIPNLSWGRIRDGDDEWVTFTMTTPGWSNLGRAPLITATAHAPAEPGSGQPVTVTVTVTDEADNPLVSLHWHAGDTPQIISMHNDGGGHYNATIPGLVDGTPVAYYVEAEDAVGLISTDPPRAPFASHGYIVGFQRPPLYLNELVAINQDTLDDEAGESDDWFEIYNAGLTEVDLGGMYLTDAIENTIKWQIPPSMIVPPGGYVVFWADSQPEQGAAHVNFKLDGDGGRLALYAGPDGHNGLIDEVYYGPQTVDQPLGRYPDGGATWRYLIPTPGRPNRQPPPVISSLGHTPANPRAGQTVTITANITDEAGIVSATLYYSTTPPTRTRNLLSPSSRAFRAIPMQPVANGLYDALIPSQLSGVTVSYYVLARDDLGGVVIYPTGAPTITYGYRVGRARPPLFINEFLAGNDSINQDEMGEYEDWVELYNAGDEPLDVGGMYLTDDLGQPTKWRIPEGTTIPASGTLSPYNGFLLIWVDGEPGDGPLHASFKLRKEGEEIGLFDRDAAGHSLIDKVVFGPQTTDISTGRFFDGGGIWTTFEVPTPAASNMLR